MPNLLVVGICGKARSGKDTVAQTLVHDFGFFRIALADGIRSAFADLDGPTWELRKDLECSSLTSRWALQTLGSECRNDVLAVHHWFDHALIKIRFMSKYCPFPRTRFVIPDIRYPAEVAGLYSRIEKWGGRFPVWKTERPGFGITGDAAKHSSETLLEEIRPDLVIGNTSSLADLKSVAHYEAHTLIERLKHGS